MRLTPGIACYTFNYVKGSFRQIRRFRTVVGWIAVLFCTILLICCSPRKGCKTVCEDDFVEPVTPEEKAAIQMNIAEMRSKLYQAPDSAELYRRLAVYYRVAGTPESRLKSMEAIERAISLDPKNPIYQVEKGLTLRSRQFYGEAEACFRRALELEPKCFSGWYQLGRLEQYEYEKMMMFNEHLRAAIKNYTKAYQLDRENEEVLIRLSYLHMFRQMYGTSKKYALKAQKHYPENPTVYLLLGTVHYQFKDFEESQKNFEKALELMDEMERFYYEDISLLLPLEEKAFYLACNEEKRKDWNRKFWVEYDPSPSTELNERRLEHYRRVFMARELFENERLGFDGPETHRGMALISYGFPHSKQYDLGGGQVGPWIVWHYDLPGGGFNLYFQDEFLNGNFHIPIAERAFGETTVRNMNALNQIFEYPVKYIPIPLRIETAQVRGFEERTRTQVSIAMPDTVLEQTARELDVFLTFFDSEWYRITRNHFVFRTDTLTSIRRLRDDFRVFSFWLELMPRPLGYHCVLEVVDEKDRFKGTWRQHLEIRDLFGRSLKLSDIQLKIIDGDGNCTDILDPIPAYDPGGMLCLSYDIYNLRRGGDNLAHYRLTYMIKEPEEEEERTGISKTFSYVWRSIKGGKEEDIPYISSTIEQSTNSSTASDDLRIDLEALERGRYLLVLEVEDLTSGETVSTWRIFIITD